MTFAFDVYRHELLIPNDSPGIFYTWGVRSTAGGDITIAPWQDRDFVYYGGPDYLRSINDVSDLHRFRCHAGAGQPGRVRTGLAVRLRQRHQRHPGAVLRQRQRQGRIRRAARASSATEVRLANDGFPANGAIDLANLGANSVRFDMAANIAPPRTCATIRATRSGSTRRRAPAVRGRTPVMHWTFAAQNPLFDAYRTAAGQSGRRQGTRTATGTVVANRYNFDLPDTGMLFPGDVLHYYFAATDTSPATSRPRTAPADLLRLRHPLPWLTRARTPRSPAYRAIRDARGRSRRCCSGTTRLPRRRGRVVRRAGALPAGAQASHYDVFTTHAPSSGVGNGLGGRATVAQIAGYTDLRVHRPVTSVHRHSSNGDFTGDAGNDLACSTDGSALGGRDLFLTGDDLANSLYVSGTVAQAFHVSGTDWTAPHSPRARVPARRKARNTSRPP